MSERREREREREGGTDPTADNRCRSRVEYPEHVLLVLPRDDDRHDRVNAQAKRGGKDGDRTRERHGERVDEMGVRWEKERVREREKERG